MTMGQTYRARMAPRMMDLRSSPKGIFPTPLLSANADGNAADTHTTESPTNEDQEQNAADYQRCRRRWSLEKPHLGFRVVVHFALLPSDENAASNGNVIRENFQGARVRSVELEFQPS